MANPWLVRFKNAQHEISDQDLFIHQETSNGHLLKSIDRIGELVTPAALSFNIHLRNKYAQINDVKFLISKWIGLNV